MKHRGIVQTADKILELMTNQYQNSRKLYLRSIYEKKSNWNIKNAVMAERLMALFWKDRIHLCIGGSNPLHCAK